MARKKTKNPSIVAVDGFFYKDTRKIKPMTKPRWTWPENPDPWAIESTNAGEPGGELPNELLNVMKAVIDGLYNDVVYTDFNKSRLMRVAYLWNKAKGTSWTNSDVYWMAEAAWKKWAKPVQQKIEDFKEGRIRRWRDNSG
jgi:hypothetical protein